MATVKRPKAFGIGDVRARAIRGPKEGRWYWRAEIHAEGGRTVWTGWASRKEAQEIVARMVADGIEPPKPAGKDELHPDDVRTVGDLLDVWLGMQGDRADIRETSLRVYRASVARILPIAGHMPIGRFGVRQMELIRDTMLRQGCAPRTVLLDLQRMRTAWLWGQEMTICPADMLRMPGVRQEKKEKRTPTAGEVARVLEHVTIPWRRVGLELMWGTGIRIGELASLTWADVDLTMGELHVAGKTGPRMVPLDEPTVRVLRAWREVSRGEGQLLGVEYNTGRVCIREAIDEACEAAGVRRFTSHGLRRAVADRLQRAGVDVATAAKLLGHSPQVMLTYYRQATESDLRDAVRRAELGHLPAGDVVSFRRAAGDRNPHNSTRTTPGEPHEDGQT